MRPTYSKQLRQVLFATIVAVQLPYAQTKDTLNTSLEQQQTYIRNIVEEEKQQILRGTKSGDLSRDLQAAKLTEIDSLVLKGMQAKEQQTSSLKDATRVVSSHKSALRKTLIIGGLSGGIVAGALAYFLSNGNSSQNSSTDSYISDTPPIHP